MTQAPLSNNTSLDGRVLWFDGDLSVTPDQVLNLFTSGVPPEKIFVTEMAGDLEQYNKLVPLDEQVRVKTTTKELDYNWNIPPEFKDICLDDFLMEKLQDEASDMTDAMILARHDRVLYELELYKNMGLLSMLPVLIYIINTLYDNNVVWGVGRGSSVSSYVLYLIGVHDIDSVAYELNIHDFLRT